MSDIKWPHLPQPRDVQVIVEHQVKRWALNRQRERADAPPVPWPVVTISRVAGTQGTALGCRLADRLGFSCWDHEIVTEIARLMHTDEAAIAALDERTRDSVVDLLGTSVFERQDASTDYNKQVRHIVDLISRRGSAVIVGRGSQFLVDPSNALRVRLVAPFEGRAHAVETHDGISFEAAKQAVEFKDNERAAYILQSTGQDVADPAHYDVVINTNIYTGERADALVLMAYLAKFGELPLSEQTWNEQLPTGPSSQHVANLASGA